MVFSDNPVSLNVTDVDAAVNVVGEVKLAFCALIKVREVTSDVDGHAPHPKVVVVGDVAETVNPVGAIGASKSNDSVCIHMSPRRRFPAAGAEAPT